MNNDLIKKVYYNVSTGYVGAAKLLVAVKQAYPDKYWTREMIDNFIANDKTAQLHKTKKKVYLKIVAPFVGYNYQMDLMDMSKYKFRGYRYILCSIDVYSRYAWGIALKDKTGQSVYDGLVIIFADGIPSKIGSDNGREFINGKIITLFEQHTIVHFTAEPGDHSKMGMIERFNRTIRNKIGLYMTGADTYDWVSALPELVKNYNNTIHTSIGQTPSNVFWKKALPKVQSIDTRVLAEYKKYPIGATVRIAKGKKNFVKGAEQTFSEDVYEIKDKSHNRFKVDGKNKLYSINELLLVNADHTKNKTRTEENNDRITAEAKQKRFLRKEGLI